MLDAAVQVNGKRREIMLKSEDFGIIERRNSQILCRFKTIKKGLPSMYDKLMNRGLSFQIRHYIHEFMQKLIAVQLIYS